MKFKFNKFITPYQIKVFLLSIVITFILQSIALIFPHIWKAYAQSPSPAATLDKAQQKIMDRTNTMKRYLKDIDSYNDLKDPKAKLAAQKFKELLTTTLDKNKDC